VRAGATLLRAGAAAGPLYIAVGAAQVLTRDGFDMRRHPLSVLSNGDFGWVQIANFLASGLLVIAGAVGARRMLRGSPGGTWGPVLLAVYGVGLIGSGVFLADPANGFPPGSAEFTGMSRTGFLHFAFGAGAFYALIGACFVFARRLAKLGQRGWATFSAVTGGGFFLAFAGLATGGGGAVTMLAFYGAVAWIWIWHSMLMARLARSPPGQ
jgi:hypothetical protein